MQILLLYFLSSFIVNLPNMILQKNFLYFSKCDNCHQKIPIYRNIPIISGLFKSLCCKKTLYQYSIHELFIFAVSIYLLKYNLLFIITFYLLYLLSIIDFKIHEIHYPTFMLFIIIQFLLFPIVQIPYFLLLLLPFVYFKYLGFADVVFMFFGGIFINNIPIWIMFSCILGLLDIKLKRRNIIPFLPYLCLTYFLLKCV